MHVARMEAKRDEMQKQKLESFNVLLTVLLSIFISVINQIETNFVHQVG